MSNLPKTLKSELAEKVDLLPMEPFKVQGSTDTTKKILWKLRDNQFIESVLIRATEGNEGCTSIKAYSLRIHTSWLCPRL